MVPVKIINKSLYPLPQYETSGSAGVDVRANIETPIRIEPLHRILIPTGLYTEIPEGYEIQVRPRSGLAIKHGISVLNTPGCCDSDYRGEIGVILINLSSDDFVIEPGDRIAQLILNKVEQIDWKPVESLSETDRGAGGFGHTGAN